MLKELLVQLQSEDTQEQELAAQEIINLKDPASLQPLIDLLSHSTPQSFSDESDEQDFLEESDDNNGSSFIH